MVFRADVISYLVSCDLHHRTLTYDNSIFFLTQKNFYLFYTCYMFFLWPTIENELDLYLF